MKTRTLKIKSVWIMFGATRNQKNIAVGVKVDWWNEKTLAIELSLVAVVVTLTVHRGVKG